MMTTYLKNTRFAAESIIRSFQGDADELNAKIRAYNATKNKLIGRGDIVVTHDNFHEVQSIVETFHEVRRLGMEINVSSTELANRKAATDTLCGALLQVAKQGIGTVHGGPAPAGIGPRIGTQPMSNVVWQARNQAMHWEEQNPHQPVRTCFEKLDADLGLTLMSQILNRSLATAVIDILDWHTPAKYESDMLAMA